MQGITLVYSADYNIPIPDFLRIHPFDSQKYGKIYDRISKLHPSLNILPVDRPITDSELLQFHTSEYLTRLQDNGYISKSIDYPYLLNLFPTKLIQEKIILPQRLMTRGTVLAARHAEQYGVAINLGGGFHHAKSDNPIGNNGGCLLGDIPLACIYLKRIRPAIKIAIIDLDIHQGNGLEEYAGKTENVYIFDMYNKNEYPWNEDDTLQYAHTTVPLDGGYLDRKINIFGYTIDFSPLSITETVVDRKVTTREYMEKLSEKLPQFIDSVKPDFIFYNAGTDPYYLDPWGCTAVDKIGILDRDEYVFTTALEHNIPIVMTFSGGYAPDSAELISDSILNLLHRVFKIERI